MNRIKILMAVGAFSLLVLGIPAIASAQYNGQYNPNGRNGGYNNGNYDIRNTLRDLKQRSNDFKREVDRQNGGIFGGISRSNNNNQYMRNLANDFKNAANRLERDYGNNRDMGRSQGDANQVLSLGNQLEQEMRRGRGGNRNLQGYWSQISYDLNVVSNTYGYNNNNRNNRYGNGNGNNYPNGNYPNGNYPNGNYPNGNYPNGNYPNGNYPNYPNNGRYNRPSWWPF